MLHRLIKPLGSCTPAWAATQAGSSVPPAGSSSSTSPAPADSQPAAPQAQHQSRATTHSCCGRAGGHSCPQHWFQPGIPQPHPASSCPQYSPVEPSIPCRCLLALQHPPQSPSARGDFAARSLCLENPNCRRLRQEAPGFRAGNETQRVKLARNRQQGLAQTPVYESPGMAKLCYPSSSPSCTQVPNPHPGTQRTGLSHVPRDTEPSSPSCH